MSARNVFIAVAPTQRVTKGTEARASAGAVRAYVGLKPATLFNKPQTAPTFTVSNGSTTVCKVWTPINN
eukprot:7814448-Pyramimonas_sp.AAC.1